MPFYFTKIKNKKPKSKKATIAATLKQWLSHITDIMFELRLLWRRAFVYFSSSQMPVAEGVRGEERKRNYFVGQTEASADDKTSTFWELVYSEPDYKVCSKSILITYNLLYPLGD